MLFRSGSGGDDGSNNGGDAGRGGDNGANDGPGNDAGGEASGGDGSGVGGSAAVNGENGQVSPLPVGGVQTGGSPAQGSDPLALLLGVGLVMAGLSGLILGRSHRNTSKG